MIFIKTMTIDGFYAENDAKELTSAVYNLSYTEHDFGKQIDEFNMVPENADTLFSNAFRMNLSVEESKSGVFRIPTQFIHFEPFESTNTWIFAAALQESTFNIFEHKSGAKSALDGYQFGYRNLFEWDLTVNYILRHGQGILFRPWLFHSFDSGLIQLFILREHETMR